MKHIRFILLILFTILFLLSGCDNINGFSEAITPEIETAVSQAIIDENSSKPYEGECPAEGHIIFGTKAKNNIIYVYSYISFSYFGFENDCFVDVSGCQMPAVFEFDADTYELLKATYPLDGADYASSIKKMFPKIYELKLNNLNDSDYESLNNQLDKYANDYLKTIGRDAKVARISDVNYQLLTDMGVSVDVSNSLSDIEKAAPYPYWIGNKEIIENGIRYIYQMDYDEENNIIIYSKYKFDNPDSVDEKIVVNSLTGEIIE